MKGLWKRIVSLMIACLLAIPLVAVGNAVAAPDPDRSCSVIVTANPEYIAPEALGQFYIEFYLVANVALEADGSLTYTANTDGGFGALEEYLIPDEETGMIDAEALAQAALLIITDESDPRESTAGVPLSDGLVEKLAPGMYVALVRGEEQGRPERKKIVRKNGEVVYATVVNDEDYEYVFSPVLEILPYYNEGGGDLVEDDGWQYDYILMDLKVDRSEHTRKKFILHKVSDSGQKLPGAKFALYATRVADASMLAGDTITTYLDDDWNEDYMFEARDDRGYLTLYQMGVYTTDQNGDIVLDTDILDDSTLYAWKEIEAPKGYKLDPEPHFFFAYGPSEGVIPFSYENWINTPGLHHATHLLYDNDNPNAAGGLRFIRQAEDGDRNIVRFYDEREYDERPIFLRVRAYGSHEEFNEETLANYTAKPKSSLEPSSWNNRDDWYDGGDGFWYYSGLVTPGVDIPALYVDVEGPELHDKDGNVIPHENYAGHAVITYYFTPAQIDGAGNYYADWTLQEEEAEEYSLSGEGAPILPLAQGGYEIISNADVKETGTARWADASYYDWHYSDGDRNNGLPVSNTIDKEEPPEEPGVELPETGGAGTAVFAITGGGMIALSLLLLSVKKRKRAR